MKNVLFTLVFAAFSVTTLQESFAIKQLKNTKRQAIEQATSNQERKLLREIQRYLSRLRTESLLEEQEKQQRIVNRRNNPPIVKRRLFSDEDMDTQF